MRHQIVGWGIEIASLQVPQNEKYEGEDAVSFVALFRDCSRGRYGGLAVLVGEVMLVPVGEIVLLIVLLLLLESEVAELIVFVRVRSGAWDVFAGGI